jgi:hypothetical protein
MYQKQGVKTLLTSREGHGRQEFPQNPEAIRTNIRDAIIHTTEYFLDAALECNPDDIFKVNWLDFEQTLKTAWEHIFQTFDISIPQSVGNTSSITIVGRPCSTKTSLLSTIANSPFHHVINENDDQFVTGISRSTIHINTGGRETFPMPLANKVYLIHMLQEQVIKWMMHQRLLQQEAQDDKGRRVNIIPAQAGGIIMPFITYCALNHGNKIPPKAIAFIRIFLKQTDKVISMEFNQQIIDRIIGDDIERRINVMASLPHIDTINRQLLKNGIINRRFGLDFIPGEPDEELRQRIETLHAEILEYLGVNRLGEIEKVTVDIQKLANALSTLPIPRDSLLPFYYISYLHLKGVLLPSLVEFPGSTDWIKGKVKALKAHTQSQFIPDFLQQLVAFQIRRLDLTQGLSVF